MPTPPPAFTFALFSTRVLLPPRIHSTIAPATVFGSALSHWASSKVAAFTTGAPLTPAVIDAPLTDSVSTPDRSVSRLTNCRSVVLAATLVTHGALAGAPIVPASGPLLPAETATKTPAR